MVFLLSSNPALSGDGLSVLDIEFPVPELEIAMAWRTEDPSSCLRLFREPEMPTLAAQGGA